MLHATPRRQYSRAKLSGAELTVRLRQHTTIVRQRLNCNCNELPYYVNYLRLTRLYLKSENKQ